MNEILAAVAILCLGAIIGLLLGALLGQSWAFVVLGAVIVLAFIMTLRSS